jgi:PAS domain S-box-containing protein
VKKNINTFLKTTLKENFNLLAVNETAIEHYGYSREEFLSMTEQDIRTEKDKEFFLKIDRSVQPGHELNNVGIWDHIKKDGTIIKVRINAHDINFDGRLASLILINDVTEKIKTKEKLQASEKRYRSTLDNMIEGVQIIDFDWKYVYVNKSFTSQVKCIEDEFTGYTLVQKFPCLKNSRIFKACRRCFDERVAIQLENEFEFPDKTIGWFQLSFQPVPEGIFILSVDVTERKRTEAALAIEKDKLDKIAMAAPGLIYSLRMSKDGSYSFTYASNSFEDIVGFSFNEVKNDLEKIFENIHPDQLEGLLHSIKVSAEKMTPWSYEYQYYHPSKGYLWLFGNSIPVKEADGGIIWHGTISDITEIKEAEAALKRSNELFQLATKASSDIVWELNFNTHEYLVYEDKERLFGPDREINWQTGIDADYIVERDRERIRSSFGNAKNDSAREKWSDEYEVVAADGSMLKVINHAIFIRDANGRATRVIGAIKDITQERKLENELQEQHRREQQMITATALEAQEKERNALGMELHDNVNQLLVGTYMLLRMIPNHPEKSDELMETSIVHIKEAIDENRKLAHELASPDLNSQNLPDLITGLCNSMLEKAGVTAVIDCKQYKECLINDKIKLSVYRVVQEQCSNIIKYASASHVSFLLSTTRNTFAMQIKDDGIGMDTKNSMKGEGIGLRNIAARMSVFAGRVIVDTSPGNGFNLSIKIPLPK